MEKGEDFIGADPQLTDIAPRRLGSDNRLNRQGIAKPAKRILATASGGGHWVQLCRLMPVFDGHDMAYLTTIPGNRAEVPTARFYSIGAASLWNKFALVRMAIQVFWILLRERPEVIISTGAAIGYFAIRFGKLFGARTIWIDSIANVNKLSISGRHVGRYADLWLTQWPQLAQPEGPIYLGAIV
jgi:UDP-N-acetylglucosamine:LPS N-acetylglucosamine transferase